MKRTNILIEMEKKNTANDLYKRSFERIFQEIGNIDYRFLFINKVTNKSLNWCDIYISIRPNNPKSYRIATAIKKAYKKYWVVFDDDLVNRPGALRWRNKSSERCIRLSDIVIGPNPLLIDYYSEKYHVNNKKVIPSFIEEREMVKSEKSKELIKIVYAAGKDHVNYFNNEVSPIIGDLFKKYGKKISFTFIGVHPTLTNFDSYNQIEYVPLMSVDEYNEFMKQHHYDIGLSPLRDDIFSSRKYFNKYIEYAKAGICGIYSNCAPYTLAVTDGINGYLVNNGAMNWFSVICQCIDDSKKREEIIRMSQNDLRLNYSLNKASELMEEIVLQASVDYHYQAVSWRNNQLEQVVFIILDNIFKINRRGLYYMRRKIS